MFVPVSTYCSTDGVLCLGILFNAVGQMDTAATGAENLTSCREASFGHGTLDVSETQLVWEWHRNEVRSAPALPTCPQAVEPFLPWRHQH